MPVLKQSGIIIHSGLRREVLVKFTMQSPMYNSSDYFKIHLKFDICQCSNKYDVLQLANTTKTGNITTWKDTTNWLAKTVTDALKRLGSVYSSPPLVDKQEFIDPCGQHTELEYEWNLYPVLCITYFLLFMFTIFVTFIVSRFVKHCIKRGRTSHVKPSEKVYEVADYEEEEDGELNPFKPTHCLDRSNSENTKSNIEELGNLQSTTKTLRNRILLQYQDTIEIPNTVNLKPKQVPVITFLKHTTDYLFSMMDKLLLESRRSPSRSSPTRSVSDLGIGTTSYSVGTPRRPLRRSFNRNRGSSPQLADPDDSSDPLEKRAWEELIQKIAMNNHVPYDFDVDLNMSISGEDRTKKLLQFYLNHGSIKLEQLQVANLIVNYCLHLLSKEIDASCFSEEICFEDFSLTGSMKKGVKVSMANQFDFHMNFHGTNFYVYEILDQQLSEEILPGKIILRAKPTHTRTKPKCLKTVQINQQSYTCLSSKEISGIAEQLIDIALQNLYTGSRSLIDRLPFRMQRCATTNLVLSIDTKSVIGLGISEIKVQIIPAIFLPINGWYQPAPLYACAFSSSQQEFKCKGARSTSLLLRSDAMWTLDLCNLEDLFIKETANKMKAAGIHSCHTICIKVLKVLFSMLSRKSLLDRGELSPNMIETVVYYLLLESTPDQWTFDLISDRVSDACLYLKSALESGRLPNFFINNPHLLKKMPFMSMYPFLLRGKQQNLLSDCRLETVDKKLNFMQDRIRDTGLEDCFKDTYSPDTWDYEFFIYS